MFKKIMGAYPPPMAEVMADDTPGETKAVLDLGCGSGSWSVTSTLWRLSELFSQCSRIMEAARDFPHCQAVAVDLVPLQSM
jgi:predicted RNA methylase